MLNISFEKKELYSNEAIAVFINDKLKIDSKTEEIDQKYHGLISKSTQDSSSFKGKFLQVLNLTTADQDGQISEAEAKGPLKENFATIDSNNDGFISEEEMKNAPKPERGQGRQPKAN